MIIAAERNASNKGKALTERTSGRGNKYSRGAGPEAVAARARVRKPLSLDHLNRVQEPLSGATWGVERRSARGHGAVTNSQDRRSPIVSAPSLCVGPPCEDSRQCGHVHGLSVDKSLYAEAHGAPGPVEGVS